MVHEAMVLEYSGRHLAMIEFRRFSTIALYLADRRVFPALENRGVRCGPMAYAIGNKRLCGQTRGRVAYCTVRDRPRSKACSIPQFLGAA